VDKLPVFSDDEELISYTFLTIFLPDTICNVFSDPQFWLSAIRIKIDSAPKKKWNSKVCNYLFVINYLMKVFEILMKKCHKAYELKWEVIVRFADLRNCWSSVFKLSFHKGIIVITLHLWPSDHDIFVLLSTPHRYNITSLPVRFI
jgi:hypothetical protein